MVDRVSVDMGSLTWSYITYDGDPYFSCQGLTNKKPRNDFISSIYPVASSTGTGNLPDKAMSGSLSYHYIYARDFSYTNSSLFKNSVSGQTLVYKLATSVTYNLTSLEVIELLKGTNNIWADCGDASIEYPADTKLYIDRKLSASQTLMELIVTANREEAMKATKAYTTGNLIIVNGTLYRATTSIANGANLTVGTNVTATTIATELANLA